jgi:hypothetical protein
MPQLVPSQVAVPFAGIGHAPHDAPHELTLLFGTHALPHAWNPLLHTKPQLTPSHVAVAFAGALHGVHDVPQLIGLSLAAQLDPHT